MGNNSPPHKQIKIALLGYFNSGKTTLIYKVKDKATIVTTTTPVFSFDVETFDYQDFTINCWSVTEQKKDKTPEREFFKNCDGILFIIDSNDMHLYPFAKEQLLNIFKNETLREKPLVILANKLELENSMNVENISNDLKLNEIKQKRQCCILECLVDGNGFKEGLNWIKESIKSQNI